jgi:hypothetical protein
MNILTSSIVDEGYPRNNLLTLSILDEGYYNLLSLSIPDEGYPRNNLLTLSILVKKLWPYTVWLVSISAWIKNSQRYGVIVIDVIVFACFIYGIVRVL